MNVYLEVDDFRDSLVQKINHVTNTLWRVGVLNRREYDDLHGVCRVLRISEHDPFDLVEYPFLIRFLTLKPGNLEQVIMELSQLRDQLVRNVYKATIMRYLFNQGRTT